ncbi:MAG TPA: Ig domain-containing protein [Acidimicrobiales bacterium]|nr:Ig domain-containing protein [Acidimicrobiales bacterium]
MNRERTNRTVLLTGSSRSPLTRLVLACIALFAGSVFVPVFAGAVSHNVDTLAITTTSLPTATVGLAYHATLDATGGTAPYTWSILTGAVPLGLVLDSSGTIGGIPGAVGAGDIALRATDATGFQVTATVSLNVVAAPVPPQQVVTVSALGRTTIAWNATQAALSGQVGSPGVVAVASSPTGSGSWCVTRAGEVFSIGAVAGFGEIPSRLAQNGVVGIASNSYGTGYWIVTRRGRVFGFGAAKTFGSLHRGARASAVVAITRSNGNGYYLLQRSGRVTGFGSDVLDGFLHVHRQRARVTAIAATLGGRGYWVVASDGRVFSFGTARADHPAGPTPAGSIVGIATAPTGIGYYLVASGGTIFSFGSALALPPVAVNPSDPVVAISAMN